MSAISIALKDIQILIKDRGAIFQLFLLPLVFIVAYSAVAASFEETTEDERIPLAVVNLDTGSKAQTFLAGLDEAGGVKVVPHELSEAEKKLETSDIGRYLTIPAGFTQDLEDGKTVTLQLLNHPDANIEQTKAVQLVVEGVAQDMALESQIIASLQQMAEMQANASPEYQEAFSVEKIVGQAESQFQEAEGQPLVSIVQTIPGQDREKAELPSSAELAVPGFLILFVFLTAQSTARSIYDEKKIGSFRRLLAAPISKTVILAGKVLPNFITALIQTTVILLFGRFGLSLMGLTPVKIGKDPLALALAFLLIALCSSSLGVLIASLARTENQIGGLSTLILWGFGALGGSIIPHFILESMLGAIPMALPHYWGNRVLDNIMIRGMTLPDVSIELAALFGFSLLFFLIGIWRFDFD